MFNKQRIICLLLSALLIISLAACKGNDPGSNSTTPPANSTGDNQQSGNESGNENDNTSQGGNNAEEAKLTGKLNLIDLDDRDPSFAAWPSKATMPAATTASTEKSPL